MNQPAFLLIGIFFLFSSAFCTADEESEQIANSLKIEANHNITRLRGFRTDHDDDKIYENEREKGLGEFLEDQEKWDLVRDRGLQEYRKLKREKSVSQKDYEDYLDDKNQEKREYEKSRRLQVDVRDRVNVRDRSLIRQLEAEEMSDIKRPRYGLRERKRNKWVKNGATRGSGATAGVSGAYSSPVPPPSDYPSITDYPPAPPAFENNFEEYPIPPVYDGGAPSVPFDSAYGTSPDGVPPPPPPPPDFDF